jgi:hypothetical protein
LELKSCIIGDQLYGIDINENLDNSRPSELGLGLKEDVLSEIINNSIIQEI